MAPASSGRVRRRARGSKRADARARSAEDWWWDRLAPRGSGYHLQQADSMLLVLPDLENTRARAHRRAPRRAPRPPTRGPTAAAKHRAKPRPEPSPDQGPDSGWGDRIPLEVLVHIFGLLVAAHGPMPFLGRYTNSACRGMDWRTEQVELQGRGQSISTGIHECSSTYLHLEPPKPGFKTTAPQVAGADMPLLRHLLYCRHRSRKVMHSQRTVSSPRAARVCRRWHEATSHPALWHTVTLSPPLVGRAAKGNLKAEKKLLASLEWLIPNRFSQLQRLTLIHWKSQVHPVLELVSKFCPRLTFLKLSDCHNVTADTLVMLAKACCQLHSLDLHHSMVESTAVVSFLEEAGSRMRKLWLTYSSQTTAILGQLLPPAPSPGGQHWHELQQHTPAAACGGSAERLSPVTGIYALYLLPLASWQPVCSLALLPTHRCYGC
ncbi:F-box/LRR-repeat protein 6 isoform X3 [Peromyscus californicus insignis]|uniref:F-box/LRR-repeat protein 6 isoform X3 n=1 Tax=Peromyscus californicus insignis TaxID=564181 RepID=UPI0022A6B89F|nr:F-box/LRR-repeat protein 6 isoform X3 [Peromyscus californicus insignis]